MDLVAIQEAINTLVNSSTTADNVSELASLYICSICLQESVKSAKYSELQGTEKELKDILPYYRKYVDIKRRYQLHQTTEGEVVVGIKKVCKEITEFIDSLYRGTDMNKERICLRNMIKQLNDKYSD